MGIIKGVGLVGGFGFGRSALSDLLLNRGTPKAQQIKLQTSNGPVFIPVLLADTSALSAYLPQSAMRRLNHYSRMAILAAFAALDDAKVLHTRFRRMGIIVCTGYGATINTSFCNQSQNCIMDIFGSPTKFASSVHNATAGLMAMVLKETGPNLSVSQYDMSVPQGLMTAKLWLAESRVDAVLVGGVDGCCYELASYRQNNKEDTVGSSTIVGEGAAFVLLLPETGNSNGYARINAINMDRLKNELSGAHLPSQMYIIGADGHGDNEWNYEVIVGDSARVANYSAIYGALPVGHMFDVAIAALSMRNNLIYPSGLLLPPVCQVNGLKRWKIIENPEPLNTDCIRCLKLGADRLYAWTDVCQC